MFYKLTWEDLEKAVDAGLTANEFKLWLYISLLDPFGDRSVELPSVEEIEEKLKMKKSSYYSTKAKLQKKGFCNFTKHFSNVKNLLGKFFKKDSFQEKGNRSENLELIPENRKTIQENGTHSEKLENPSLKHLQNNDFSSSQTIKTDQTIHTLSDGEKEKKEKINVLRNEEINNEQHNNSSAVVKNQDQIKNFNYINSEEDKNFRTRSTKVIENQKGLVSLNQSVKDSNLSEVQRHNWNWLPEGAWCIEGKLDPNFQEWLAKKWMNKYQNGDIYEYKANVLSYFRNDPAKLPIRWEQYHSEYLAKAENIKFRLDNDCKISDEQKQEAIARMRAINNVDPSQSVSVVNELPVNEFSSPQIPIMQELLPNLNQEEKVKEKPPNTSSSINSTSQGAGEITNNNDNLNFNNQQDLSKNDETYLKEQAVNSEEEVPVNHKALALIQDFINGFGGSSSRHPKDEELPIHDDVLDKEEEVIEYVESRSPDDCENEEIIQTEGLSSSESEIVEPIYGSPLPNSSDKQSLARYQHDNNDDQQIWSEENKSEEKSVEEQINNNDQLSESKTVGSSLCVENKGILKIQAKMINIGLKSEKNRRSPNYKKYVEQFIEMGWLVDYDSLGNPIEVYEF